MNDMYVIACCALQLLLYVLLNGTCSRNVANIKKKLAIIITD